MLFKNSSDNITFYIDFISNNYFNNDYNGNIKLKHTQFLKIINKHKKNTINKTNFHDFINITLFTNNKIDKLDFIWRILYNLRRIINVSTRLRIIKFIYKYYTEEFYQLIKQNYKHIWSYKHLEKLYWVICL